MKKTIILIATAVFIGSVSGLEFSQDQSVQGEVNSSPPMPGENFTGENNLSEKENKSSEASNSSEEDIQGAFEDDDEDEGLLSKLIEWLIGLIPFI